jgi:N-acetyl-anhydromuramyl-L-alanine amidase AmpD
MDEAGALWIPNNNYFSGRNGYKPRYVILHGTAGFTSAEEVANFFKATEGGENPVSTHYIIGLRSELIQCVGEEEGAYGISR